MARRTAFDQYVLEPVMGLLCRWLTWAFRRRLLASMEIMFLVAAIALFGRC